MRFARILGGGLVVAAISVGLLPTGGGARGANTEAVGLAVARVAAVAPLTANLALEVGMAQSGADISGQVARGESSSFTFGIIGLLAGSLPVALPQPAKADTRNTERIDRTAVLPPIGVSPVVLQTTHERAWVSKAPPSGAARTTLGDVEIPNLLSIGGGVSEARIDANLGQAMSSVGELSIAPLGQPLVVLEGLEWRAAQEAGTEPTASFSIGSGWVMGTRYPADGPAEMKAFFEAANTALGLTGLMIVAPEVVTLADGSRRVTPLRVQLRDAQIAKETAGRVYPNVAEQVNAVLNGVGDNAPPEAGLGLLVANVGIAALTGNGGVRAEIGGATARLATREIPDLDQFRKKAGAAGAPGGGDDGDSALADLTPTMDSIGGDSTGGPRLGTADSTLPAASFDTPVVAPAAANRAANPVLAPPSGNFAGDELAAMPAATTEGRAPAPLIVLLALGGLAALGVGDHARYRKLALTARQWTEGTPA